ncbi:MAG: flagellar basal-body MS-ring/collar protein FliF [Desulfobacteraceae bacterium]|jgi:flagellar M-ring protein FliF
MAEEETSKGFLQQTIGLLKGMPPARRVSLAVTLLLVVGGFAALLFWTNRPDYQVLFSNLATDDAAKITEKLKEMRVPFQLKEGGSAVLVPEENVYQLRLDLASEGLPRGNAVGFEIFDEMGFGATEFVQKLKYQQALQGELARTIMQFDTVSQARVHIVTTGDSLFAEPEKPATASVVLRLVPGQVLNRQQIQGIVNLVARAVEGLHPSNVTLVDMEGGLISQGQDSLSAGGMSRSQFEYQRNLERSLENRIQTMLEPVVGTNKVVARVAAEVDFRQVNISEESFDPESAVVRSEQRQKESSVNGQSLPSGSPDLKYQTYQSQTGGVANTSRGFEKENSVVNYEINRINRQIVSSVGDITRLTAAVVIDGPYTMEENAEGEVTQAFAPRSRREMKTFEEIIKKAIGFDESRGDQVSVTNIAFALQAETGAMAGAEAGPSWLAYVKKASRPALNLLLIGLFFLLAVRPFRKWLSQANRQQAMLGQGENRPQLEAGPGGARAETNQQTELLEIAKKNPEMAAEIIRGWLTEGSS